MEGWISIHRKILDNPIVCKDSETFAIWLYLLLSATHKEIPAVFKGKKITLKKGQLITGILSISKKLKINKDKIQRTLKCFEVDKQIEQQTSNKNRLITILNWKQYQDIDNQNDKQMINKCETTDKQLITNNNVNNVNNIYKEIGKFTQNEKLINAINEFIEYRKQKKKVLTELALKKILNQFKRWNYTDEECIESINNSIINGWTGIFELKDRRVNTTNKEDSKYIEIDTSQLTEDEYGKLMRNETTIQELIEKGRINV